MDAPKKKAPQTLWSALLEKAFPGNLLTTSLRSDPHCGNGSKRACPKRPLVKHSRPLRLTPLDFVALLLRDLLTFLASLLVRVSSQPPWCVRCSLHAYPTSGVGCVW